MLNGGGWPPDFDKSTLGHPGKYSIASRRMRPIARSRLIMSSMDIVPRIPQFVIAAEASTASPTTSVTIQRGSRITVYGMSDRLNSAARVATARCLVWNTPRRSPRFVGRVPISALPLMYSAPSRRSRAITDMARSTTVLAEVVEGIPTAESHRTVGGQYPSSSWRTRTLFRLHTRLGHMVTARA